MRLIQIFLHSQQGVVGGKNLFRSFRLTLASQWDAAKSDWFAVLPLWAMFTSVTVKTLPTLRYPFAALVFLLLF